MRMIRLALGVAAILAGVTLAATLFASSAVEAGVQQPPCFTPTPAGVQLGQLPPTDTATPTNTAIPVCTPTPQIVRSATPTFTVTPAATNTPVPATEAPATNTPVPPAPSATSPSGGTGGTAIQPPNTGSGPGGAGPSVLPLVMTAVALMVAGSGTLAVATRRRRA